MELMKRKLCFKITAKLGNSKRQHCSWQEKKKRIEPERRHEIQHKEWVKVFKGEDVAKKGKVEGCFVSVT